MLNFNLFENIVIKCFFGGKKAKYEDEEIDKKIYNLSKQYKISILPINPNFDIDNLYPLTDHVELWNIFIIGNDKTYILANVNDPYMSIPGVESLPNKQGHNVLPEELALLFDSLWTKTLQGKQLQFYIVWNSKLYFVNTYPFYNGQRKVIGAILFMRAFDTMPDMVGNRFSIEKKVRKSSTSGNDPYISETNNSTGLNFRINMPSIQQSRQMVSMT